MLRNDQINSSVGSASAFLLAFASAIALDACGGSGGAMPPPPTFLPTQAPTQPPGISVAFAAAAYAIDNGQTEPIIANVTPRTNADGGALNTVAWSVTCPSGSIHCGAMSSPTTASGTANTYNAPTGISTSEVVTITATSMQDHTKTVAEQLTVNPSLVLVLPAPVPADASIGANYTLDLSQFAQGGTAPLAWAITSGKLPSGLGFNPSGTISGIAAGPPVTQVIGLLATDASKPGMDVNVSISITVVATPPLTITSGTPPGGSVGKVYGNRFFYWSGFWLTASGGVGLDSWSWAADVNSSLPPGLAVENRSVQCVRFFYRHCLQFVTIPARIFGTPSAAGTYHVVVTVADSAFPQNTASAHYTIVIGP